MSVRQHFRFSLRAKLALLSLTLIALPWAGYRYVREMEGFLLEAQEQALLATARAVATVLHDRPQLMRLKPAQTEEERDAAEERLREAADTLEASGAPVLVEEIGRESGVSQAQSVAEITQILKGMQRSTARIWVVNRELKLLALAGSLKSTAAQPPPKGFWPALLARIVPRPAQDFDEALDEDVLASGREITHALLGAPATRLRNSVDGRAVIVSAAWPIWSHDDVVGAVVVEETTHSILSVRSQALERLLTATLLAFALVAAALLGFATRLSARIRRLRDEAESAVDARGRLTRLVSGSQAHDEIGDLSRSFSAMLEKLGQHHGYLQSLAGRLSHELRTPMAVVRSSLENLKLEDDPAQRQVYLERAEEGLARLSKILTRMGEATRLEQGLQGEVRVPFDLAGVVEECTRAFEQVFAPQPFELALPGAPLFIEGSPDLFAQLLDKLVANAVDFSRAGAPIRIALTREANRAVLEIANSGPPLTPAVRGRLFGAMVSARENPQDGVPHLGLGLYIARLITEFHGGTIGAEDLPDASGVLLRLTFPLSPG